MMKTKSKSIIHRWHEKIEKLIVKYRNRSLLIAAIIGVGLAFFIYYVFSKLNGSVLHSSITILFLGLPTFYVLWKFRTHDVQRQIDKTEENTNNSTFFECARMLTEEIPTEEMPTEEMPTEEIPAQHDSLSKKTALEQLAYLKKETGFDEKRIDSLTRVLDLRGKSFNLARFSGLDLSIANLNKAKLSHADLTGTKLIVTKLNGAKLYRAKLIEADLNGAKLNGADLSRAKLKGAILNKAELIGAILIDAELSGAKLNDADLANAELNGADLTEADLRGAKLSRADLNDANLTGAIYDSKTKFIGTILESQEMCDKAGMIYRPDESA